jgi:hypothetical protein
MKRHAWIVDDMTVGFELLHWDLGVLRKQQDIPIFEPHFTRVDR